MSTNKGIQTGGGAVTATNIAVGDRASLTVPSDQGDLAAMLARLRTELATLEPNDRAEAETALDTAAQEVAKPDPDPALVKGALESVERAAKSGTSLVDFGERIAPHLLTVARLLMP